MSGLVRGFGNAVLESQICFRSILRALSAPGEIQDLATATPTVGPLTAATVAVSLTLLDNDTPVWLDTTADVDEVRDYLRFHCGAPLVDEPGAAAFAIVADATKLNLGAFSMGDDRYPDRSATLIVQVPTFANEAGAQLSGPGIKATRTFSASGLPPDFAEQWHFNTAAYPLGVDLLFTTNSSVAALSRTTRWNAA